MPILDDIMDYEVLGRERKRSIALGREEGERGLIVRLLTKRFGAVPDWARQRLASSHWQNSNPSPCTFLEAQTLEELLGQL